MFSIIHGEAVEFAGDEDFQRGAFLNGARFFQQFGDYLVASFLPVQHHHVNSCGGCEYSPLFPEHEFRFASKKVGCLPVQHPHILPFL